MAIASLLLGILCILATLISCAVSGELFYQNAVLISMMMLTPAILAVICGHIGQYRARLTRGLAVGYITNDGLVIGYLFGALCLASIIARLFLGF